MQLVLKALITIGDLPNQIEAAMVIGACLEMEEGEGEEAKANKKDETSSEPKNSQIEGMPEGRRVVRRRSASK
mgnify:CR=1 FL=1